MATKQLRACEYSLRTSPEVVRRLGRDGHDLVIVGNNNVRIPDLRLIVPSGINVYRVIPGTREEGGFFFTTQAMDTFSQAYVSMMTKEEFERLGELKHSPFALFNYPWVKGNGSNKFYARIFNKKPASLKGIDFVSCFSQDVEGIHPYS